MNQSSSSIMRRNRGFTLIELLVVMSIISLLIALLLPVLKQSRIVAVRVQCLAQIRAIGPAMSSYATSNKGAGPPHSFPFTSTIGETSPLWNTGRAASNGFPAFTGLDDLFGYDSSTADTSKFYYRSRGCPDYKKGVQSFDPAFTANHWMLGLIGESGAVGGSNSRNKWIRLDNPRVKTSLTCIAVESNTQSLNGSDIDPSLYLTMVDQPRVGGGFNHFARHDGSGLNFLYVDGHGAFLSSDQQGATPGIINLPIFKPF